MNQISPFQIEKMSTLLARYKHKEISQFEFEHTFAHLHAL